MCYLSTYNVDILIFFNPELQLQDTDSAIRNKVKDVLTDFEGFKFATTLILELKNRTW